MTNELSKLVVWRSPKPCYKESSSPLLYEGSNDSCRTWTTLAVPQTRHFRHTVFHGANLCVMRAHSFGGLSWHLAGHVKQFSIATTRSTDVDGSEIRRENQLTWRIYPVIFRVLYISGGCWGFFSINTSMNIIYIYHISYTPLKLRYMIKFTWKLMVGKWHFL